MISDTREKHAKNLIVTTTSFMGPKFFVNLLTRILAILMSSSLPQKNHNEKTELSGENTHPSPSAPHLQHFFGRRRYRRKQRERERSTYENTNNPYIPRPSRESTSQHPELRDVLRYSAWLLRNIHEETEVNDIDFCSYGLPVVEQRYQPYTDVTGGISGSE